MYYIILYCIVLYFILLYFKLFQCIVFYCILFYFIVLSFIVLALFVWKVCNYERNESTNDTSTTHQEVTKAQHCNPTCGSRHASAR